MWYYVLESMDGHEGSKDRGYDLARGDAAVVNQLASVVKAYTYMRSVVIYRPPKTNLSGTWQTLETLVHSSEQR